MRYLFNHCPSCKTPKPEFINDKELICRSCGWNYFHNVAAAAAVFISTGPSLLFIRRNRNPGKGLLDLPGGFVDPAESAEDAIRREVMEELGVGLKSLSYFISYPNRYLYADVWYNTCDLYFRAAPEEDTIKPNNEEIAAVEFFTPEEYSKPAFMDNLAFESAKKAVRKFATPYRNNHEHTL